MKKLKFIVVLLGISLFSCEKDFLDLVPDNVPTIDNAFSNRASTKKMLATCYSYLPNNGDTNSDVSLLSGDELSYPPVFDNRGAVRISKGYQDSNFAYLNKWSGTESYYVAIRNCNLFLSRINEVPDIQEYEREIWTSEVTFLKAYYHFLLVQMYGPIVINDTNLPISSSAEELARDRNKIDEIFPYIIGLIDEAKEFLPEVTQEDEFGRVTQSIALAIKARVAMTYASPMFNGNPIYTEFVNTKGENYFPTTFDKEKWADAAKACKNAIDTCMQAGLRLHQTSDYKQRAPQADITLLKAGLRGRVTDPFTFELIWGIPQTAFGPSQSESMPKLFRHQGGNPVASRRGVNLRIAEQFYSNNGVPINEDITYDYANRYKLKTATQADQYYVEPNETTVRLHFNREPRFYADISFDRGTWFGNGKERTDEAWYYRGRSGEYGAKTELANYSPTGYFPKKLVNIKTTVSNNLSFGQTRYAFPIIRMTDLYLYYAEALNESEGPSAEVYENIDIIRERAGLNGVVDSWTNFSITPNKPDTQDGLRKIIQQERLIEMAFEGNRFWDLRRWLLAKDVLNKPIKGWNVLGESNTGEAEVFYQLKTLNLDKFSRFEEKDYLWPISKNEIINISTLIQNPGWE